MRAFIFDIDGTLVDSNELHVDSWDRAFRKFGKQFPRESYGYRWYRVGGLDYLLRRTDIDKKDASAD